MHEQKLITLIQLSGTPALSSPPSDTVTYRNLRSIDTQCYDNEIKNLSTPKK